VVFFPTVSYASSPLSQQSDIAKAIQSKWEDVDASRAYLRKDANIHAKSIGVLKKGDHVFIIKTSLEYETGRIWCYVDTGTQVGWISYKTLNLDYHLQDEYIRDSDQ
jgi:hypothetical protein